MSDPKNLAEKDLTNVNVSGGNLAGADLRRAKLTGAKAIDTDFSGADLREADLTDANLGRASLREANLSDANLTRTDLRHADLSGAKVGDRSRLDAARLDGAHGLDDEGETDLGTEPNPISGHQHHFEDVEPATDTARTYHGLDNPA
jgi:uncharacterized protein YjbI with pentapeptide repeats